MNLRRRRAGRCLVVGGGRVAARKVEGLLDVEARGARRRAGPRATTMLRHARRSPASARPYRSGRPRRLPARDRGHRRPGGQRAPCSRDAEAAGVWVNGADDPDNCTFTLPAVLRRGPLLVTFVDRAAAARRSRRGCAAARGRVRARVRDAPRPAGRRARCHPRPRSLHRGPRLAERPRLGNAGPDPRGTARRSEGAPAGVSVVVIGLNHRTVPLDLLERMTVARRAACPRPCTTSRPRARHRGRRALHLQPHRGLRGGRAVPRRRTGHPQLLLRAGVPAARGLRRPPLRPLRRRGGRPPLRGRRRARLGRGRRERDPRPGAGGVGARARHEGATGPRAQPAVPPRPRGRQAGPHRDRHRPRDHVGRAGRGGDGRRAARLARGRRRCSCSAPARWARAWRSRSPAAGVGRRRRRQPHLGPRTSRLAARVGGRALRLERSPRRTRRGRRAAHVHRRTVDDARARPTSCR